MKYIVVLLLVLVLVLSITACSNIKEVPVGELQPSGGKVSLNIVDSDLENSSDNLSNNSSESDIEEIFEE